MSADIPEGAEPVWVLGTNGSEQSCNTVCHQASSAPTAAAVAGPAAQASSGELQVVEGDLIKVREQYIVHQTNCGVDATVHSRADLWAPDDPRHKGTKAEKASRAGADKG